MLGRSERHRLLAAMRRFFEKGISIVCGIRIRWSNYDFIPRIYSKEINARADVQCKALWIFCVTGIIFNTILLIILKYYSFEASVKLIRLDTRDDIAEDRLGGTVVTFTGWDYAKKFPDVPEKLQPVTTRSDAIKRSFRVDSANVNNASAEGIWIAYSSIGKSNNPSSKPAAYLVSKMLLRNFQFMYPHELRLGLRVYLHGRARIQIVFHSTHSPGPAHKMILYENGGNDKSLSFSTKEENSSVAFCPKIIDPPQEHGIRYDSIDIIAITPTKNSVVVIDQVLLALGNQRRSLHMLYSFYPKAWCGKDMKLIDQDK